MRYFVQGVVIGTAPAIIGAVFDVPGIFILAGAIWSYVWTSYFEAKERKP